MWCALFTVVVAVFDLRLGLFEGLSPCETHWFHAKQQRLCKLRSLDNHLEITEPINIPTIQYQYPIETCGKHPPSKSDLVFVPRMLDLGTSFTENSLFADMR